MRGYKFFLADDDRSVRKMLGNIITENRLGEVIGEAANGIDAEKEILDIWPDISIIDLLMPRQDGIETVRNLKKAGYKGMFVMLSQVEQKEMVKKAYEEGIDYYITKPINITEVLHIVNRVIEVIDLKKVLKGIKQSISLIGEETEAGRKDKSLQDKVKFYTESILMDMGILGESGSIDVVNIMLMLHSEDDSHELLENLNSMYENLIANYEKKSTRNKMNIKALEQRIRRVVKAALKNLAALGVEDYQNPKFEDYAFRYFDFIEVRKQMQKIKENKKVKIKLNIKKFLKVMYFDVNKKLREAN